MNPQAGKYLVAIGVVIIVIGIVIYFFSDKLHWIGRLPGDIRVERENFKFYFPITTMIIASIVISLLIKILRRF